MFNTNQFYSSLIVNSKKFPNVHQVFRPRYNKEFFKRLTANVEQLEAQIEKRCKNCGPLTNKSDFKNLKENLRELIKLKERLEKLEKRSNENHPKCLNIKTRLESIEEHVMPFAVLIPNRSSKYVPSKEVILDQLNSNFAAEKNLTKVINHRKLSYINNCYSKSVVGPNSHYYYGIGAKLQHGLADFFTNELERKDFIPISGLCLTKSAVVEATNSRDLKDYTIDPCRILSEDTKFTTLHLVEASRESLLGFVTTIGPRSSNYPLRLMTNGAGYRIGSNWFDSDEKRVTQFETLHALTLTSSIEQYSMKEYHDTRDIIWNIYKKLQLPTRLIQCSLDSMLPNEYDAHRIDVWLPSSNQWIQVGRVSHYLDYITVRAGMKRGHIIDSMVYDGQALVAAIIENNQTSAGKFIIPSVIKDHMIYLTESEDRGYFRGLEINKVANQMPISTVLNNYEQRRYLVKKSYLFGHSKRARKNNSQRRNLFMIPAVFTTMFLILIDWNEIWIQFVPKSLKRILYDNFYRVIRRGWWIVVYPEGTSKPNDLSFDELDHEYYEKNMFERRREIYEKLNPRDRERLNLPSDK